MNITAEDRLEIIRLYRNIIRLTEETVLPEHLRAIKQVWRTAIEKGTVNRSVESINPLLHTMQTAWIVVNEIGMRRSSVICAMLYENNLLKTISIEKVEKLFGPSTAGIMRGLIKVNELYDRNTAFDTENFRNLLLSFAQDARVILIMIADRVNTMRTLHLYPDEMQNKIAKEAFFLFAPLAHRMGLYGLKTELEDISLKYSQPAVYEEITKKLAEGKDAREAYIKRFIQPVKEKLQAAIDVPFEIKGRTKSVYSIWNKLRKQHVAFEDVYDIFAIRIILDSPMDREKADCWHAYSIVTDMYQPNPSRTRDWLSIPKSNGYESLHTTVLGPEEKWVEVQIRTTRMNEIAEKGLAAHWRYKGIKSEKGLDQMLTHIREMIEAPEDPRLVDDFKMELYEDEIYVFSPKGELYKLPSGASVLDFAYSIHSNLGNRCVGARVNGKNVPIRYRLKSGDAVEIQTGSNQTPKQDWLNFVVTTKARNKIKQTLKEDRLKLAEFGRDNLLRRIKNRKAECDEVALGKLLKRFKLKTLTDFYAEIGEGHLDINQVLDAYLESISSEKAAVAVAPAHSAEDFEYDASVLTQGKEDVLVIDQNLRGLDFKMAKCCNPIYGDDVFGFVSVSGGIKIHKVNCPNAPQMRQRYGYRLVKARWAGKVEGSQYPVTLQVIGNDDIGIVTNITSLISKETNVSMRSIRIDSTDGLFRGYLTIMVSDTKQLEALIKKIRAVKGVKQVIRE